MNATTASPDDATIHVVIVGAGPTGLATACALAHHDVRFRILERAHDISGASKGHNVIARVQELLDAIGLPGPFGPVLFCNRGVMEKAL